MKKLAIINLILLTTLCGCAQNKDNFIEVRGACKIDPGPIKSYQIDFLLLSQSYMDINSKYKLECVKKLFFEKVKGAGFEANRFKEDRMGYLALQHYVEGKLYTFTTTDKEELMKATSLVYNYNGGMISIVGIKSLFNPVKDTKKLFEAALNNSKETGSNIAKSMNKKLGDILSIQDFNDLETLTSEDYYYKSTSNKYYVIVAKFAIQ